MGGGGRVGGHSAEKREHCSNSKSMLTFFKKKFFKFTFFNLFLDNREGGTFSQEGRTLCFNCICTARQVTNSVASTVRLKHPAQSSLMGSYRLKKDVVIRKLIGLGLHEGNNQPSIRQEVNIAVTTGDTDVHQPQGEALDGGTAGRPYRAWITGVGKKVDARFSRPMEAWSRCSPAEQVTKDSCGISSQRVDKILFYSLNHANHPTSRWRDLSQFSNGNGMPMAALIC